VEKSYVGQDIPVLEVLRFDMRNAIFVSGNADMIFDRDNLIYSVADLQYALGGMEYATLVRDVEEVLQFATNVLKGLTQIGLNGPCFLFLQPGYRIYRGSVVDVS
jgi:hypothetical protein